LSYILKSKSLTDVTHKMSRQAMTEEDKRRLISEFVDVTGADEDAAKFFMESSSWDLPVFMHLMMLLNVLKF